MGYFVPMGLGTTSEDGSELVTNTGSGITKAGWGGLAVPLNSDNAQCSVNSKNNRKVKINDKRWGVSISELRWSPSAPLKGALGKTKDIPNGIDFHCVKLPTECPKYKIKGDYGIKSNIFISNELPVIENHILTGWVLRDADKISQTKRHEQTHANYAQALKEKWYSHSELNEIWDSKEECELALGNPIQPIIQENTLQGKVNTEYNIEQYQECIHSHHIGEALQALNENGEQIDWTDDEGNIYRYPLGPEYIGLGVGFEACERLPKPHNL